MSKIKIFSFLVGSFIILGGMLNFYFLELNFQSIFLKQENSNEYANFDLDDNISLASENSENLEDLFDQKINCFNTYGYFPEIYENSIQATYYALFILEKIGRLSEIDQGKTLDYIISNFDSNSNLFMDKNAYRYLDTDFSFTFIPFSTVLEVNCYAILSLDILGRLDLVNIPNVISFIWSCYNTIDHGFIGQTYRTDLTSSFKISTVDNTYYAIATLNLLNGWSGHSVDKGNIIQYLNNLQSQSLDERYFGGFYNDFDYNFKSFEYLLDFPNLISSYYSVKALESLGFEYSIRPNDLYDFMEGLYVNNSNLDYFQVYYPQQISNCCNIVASAFGLEISDIYSYSFDRNDMINFILNGRNSDDLWKASTNYIYAELIDTYQVIHALNEAGEISRLGFTEKNNIVSGLQKFYHINGFSLISEDYTSLELINTIISTGKILDRIPELNLQELYTRIENIYLSSGLASGFFGNIMIDSNNINFRSYPFEYYSIGTHHYLEEVNFLKSHKTTFFALDSLKKIYKLDDFDILYDLNALKNDIINSQFLDPSYDNYGGFLSHLGYSVVPIDIQNKTVYIEYSYFAIKTLEIICNFLSLGPITNQNFNKTALSNYLKSNMIETPSLLSFQQYYLKNIDDILEDTYHSIYILKAINQYNLDNQKIKNLITQSINYSSIKNLYYCFKINDLLSLNINFNFDLASNIINFLYSDVLKEYYLTSEKKSISQEIFLWICEMYEKDFGLNSIVNFMENAATLMVEVNISLKTLLGPEFLDNPTVYMEIYRNGQFYDLEYLNLEILDIQRFILDYKFLPDENYIFKVYLDNGITINHLKLGEYIYTADIIALNNENETILNPGENLILSIPLVASIITIPSCVIFFSSKKKRNLKLKYNSKKN